MQKRLLIMGGLLAAVTVGGASSAQALVVSGPDMAIDFRFNNPGARSNAMGGAFIGVADDASTAYTNPAGLTILSKPETAMEMKSTTNTNPVYFEDGSKHEFDNTTYGLSYLGYAKPLDKVAFAIYRHQLLNISQKIDDQPFTRADNIKLALNSELNIKAVTYGVGVAAKLHDRLSLGVSVGLSEINYFYQVNYFQHNVPLTYGTYGTVNSSDSAEQYAASLLYNPFGELNIGLVYRYGAAFETMYSDSGTRLLKNTLDVPDMYGCGISYRFFNSLTVAADVNQIKYSDLLNDFRYFDSSIGSAGDGWVANNGAFEIPDTTETHIGFEYVSEVREMPVALRGGYYHRPDHSLRYNGNLPHLNQFRAGDDDNIYSLGLGMVFDNNIQVDLAGSLGDLVKEYTLSMVYRF